MTDEQINMALAAYEQLEKQAVELARCLRWALQSKHVGAHCFCAEVVDTLPYMPKRCSYCSAWKTLFLFDGHSEEEAEELTVAIRQRRDAEQEESALHLHTEEPPR